MAERASKAVILSRVSSKDQKEGYSPEVQIDRLEKYCERKKLRIIRQYEIAESSTRGDRKKFMEIISFIKQQKEPIAFVADKIDRIQRSHKETPILDELRQQGRLEIHLNSEGYVLHKDSSAHELMVWGIGIIIGKCQTDILSENVQKSFKQKIEVYGELCGIAPLGYLNKRYEKERSTIIVDEVRAPVVKRIFEEYATGAYTISEMAKKSREWGLRSRKGYPITKGFLHRVIQNPFYYGEMKVKGQLWKHRYEPLISREVFNKCEAVRMGWNKKPFQYRSREFLFRGMVTCAVTGRLVSPDSKTKTYANGTSCTWAYLRTWNPADIGKTIWVRESEVIEKIEKVLKGLKIKDPQLLQHATDYLRNTNNDMRQEHNRQVGVLKQEHTKIRNKLDSFMDLVADGVISREDYLNRKSGLMERKYELDDLLKNHDKFDDVFAEKLVSLINISSEAHKIFAGGNLNEKREFLNLVFANLKLKGYKLDYSLRFPFCQMEKVANCLTRDTLRDPETSSG